MVEPSSPLLRGKIAGNDAEEKELDLQDILTQLLARKWWIAAAVLLGGLIGAFIGQLGPDSFRATSVIQIEKRDSGVILPGALIGEILGTSSSESSLDTEIHIINSRLIMGPVVQQLDLDTRVEPRYAPVIGEIIARRPVPYVDDFLDPAFIRAGERLSARFTDVPETEIGRRIDLRVTGPDTYAVTLRGGEVLSGRAGEPLELGRFHTLVVDEIMAAAGREFIIWKEPVRRSVERIRRGLSVRERGRSGIVDFNYTAGDPRLAQSLVNTIVETYQAANLERRSVQIEKSIEFIEEQLTEVRTNLGAANAALLTYREEQQSQQLSLDTQQLLSRAISLETEIQDLNFQERALRETLTPNHPTFRALIQKRKLAEERLASLRTELETLPEAEQELARLTGNLERLSFLEQQLMERVEQLGIQRASTVGNIRILEPAEDARATTPSRKQPALIGLGTGLLLSILMILVLNFFRRGIDDARTVEEMGLSLFATVNKVNDLRSAGAKSNLYALAEVEPDHLSVEALRGLRTGLQFALATVSSRSIMITSTAPGDGKSFISFNLALVLGQAESRILLIDADMRKGILRKQFGLSKTHLGLSDYLAGKATLEDVVVQKPNRPIDFIPTGSFPPNAADLLTSPKFKQLMEMATQHYDLVIVDAPPVLAVSDPTIIGQVTGMTLLVVAHLITTKTEIQSALKSLDSVGISPAGAVMNQFDPARSRYGHYGTKYGYYGGYHYKYK